MVKMMPRRRTKGSQVFTKAPTLTERREGNMGGKGLVSACATQSPVHPNPEEAAAPEEAPGTTPSPPNLVNQGAVLSLAPTLEDCQPRSWQMLFQAPGQRCDTSLVGTGDMPPFLSLTGFIHNHPYLWGAVSSKRTRNLSGHGSQEHCLPTYLIMGPTGRGGVSKSQQCCGWSQGSGFSPGSAPVSVWPQFTVFSGDL